ncbi:hypothetical protein [Nitriliruptor alkaliphilus]|uniref:hypothetical protein n=1 Tax=Nitriliruptor alkaliphilus TaxID=427918 RepID=UPI000695A7EE|nr:hypothetical protein [Nitriliruptor alkaliphilus]
MVRSRYGAWDGSQDPMGERVDIADALDGLADDLLMGTGGQRALRELQQRGLPGERGLDDLRRALARQRRELQRELDDDGPLAALRDQLERIVATEREALAQADDPDARLGELDLDTQPTDPAGRFRALADYDFRSPDAAQAYDELADQLRRDLLDTHLRALTGALESVTREDQARIAAMLGDLNAMLEARAANGGQPPPDEAERFAAFKAAHGDLLPGDPTSLDELLAAMAERAAAAAAFLRSLPPEQRQQLEDLARQVFDDVDLQFQLGQLGGNLAAAFPDGVPGAGDGDGAPPERPEPGDAVGPLSAAVDAYARVAELEDLERALQGDHPGASLEDIDEEALRRNLGDEAVGDLRRLQQLERELERSGAMRVEGGELTLTPRGARQLGQRSLARLMARVRREPATRTAGADPEPTGQTRPWVFGDREPIAVGPTVRNAVMRRVAGGGTPGTSGRGVRLHPDDLEVVETEVRPRTATALLLDLSFSMPLQGHFVPAKRMALALHALIEGNHRQDSLHLIGFSDYARRMQPADLAAAGFERVYGTNMHHAFLLARRVLADDPRPVKRVVMVTDGEPTAHLVDGRSIFNWPPVPETLEATLREAMRLARSDIELDVFLLEDAPGLLAFAERLAGLTGGEVFRMTADEVGRTVVSGYASGVRRPR